MYMLRFKFSSHKNVLKPSRCFVFLHENKVKEAYPLMLNTLILLNIGLVLQSRCVYLFS